MSQFYETPVRGFTAGAALALYLRAALLSTGKLALAGAGEIGVGTIETQSFADGDVCSVRLITAQGTRKVITNAAITAGALVYAAASGKVGPTGTICLGEALEAATADGDVIEVLSFNADPGVVRNVRRRCTIAEVNAGVTLLPAVPGLKYRLIEASAISVGGAAAAVTTVDIIGTQTTAAKLVAFAQASLTQNTQLKSGGTGAAILAGGASYIQNDVNTAITVGKTGSDVTTATHIDVIASYVLES